MRYTSALLLGALAAGEAAAHSIRHAGFHGRRHNEAKEAKRQEPDWSTVKYDLTAVKWDEVNWSSVFDLKNKRPSPTAAPSSAPVYQPAEPTPEPEAPEAPEQPQESPKEEEPERPSGGNGGGNGLVDGIVDGIDALCSKKGIQKGKNSKSPNGGIWLGSSDWQAKFTNGGSEDVWLTCWNENGFTGMTLNVNRPEILVKIPVGKTQTVSFAPKKAASCAPIYSNTKLAMFGGFKQTWFEANFGPTDGSFVGTFDVSKNVFMHGDDIEAKGSKCVSDMNTCVYECKDKSAESCEFGYELRNCDAGNGGGQGYDVVMQGVGGGCNMGARSENINVTFRNRG
ncbi:hypothetical protein M011DRAFT_406800 [Sporormia fimetaria CBS 119925]|uniref:Uncharacterized protein n=1 Tax=Sporormia fimetaria CBS 119925 TaxID=1340428 RepID=A0A6A6V5L5_9PLEO|nr:hypothetical protein M011DRAFT_406800 [Sporormia fimetaria CBS 119925]